MLLLLFTALSIAQEAPVLKTGKTQVGLSSLDISVQIIGNKATTTFDMLYYNPTDQILEGQLSFPLGENFNVSRFALDVNGKLREAVVVDKELGRIAFEDVVRRRVDPALLEKGTGNNYKARIYPIPANGYKRVVLAYEQELLYKEDGYYFDLPLHFKNKLDIFKLTITVFEQEEKPVIEKGQVSGLNFTNWKRNYTTKVEKTNYIPNKSLLIKIPTKVDSKKVFVADKYFYSHLVLNPQKKIRDKAKTITLFWDASLSMKDRNIEKEIALLSSYFSYVQNVKVNFKSFSNTVLTTKTFTIRNGNWKGLKDELIATVYDGGTNYNVLDTKIKESDLVLLFSDGIQSLSALNYSANTPLIVVNSLTKSNHPALQKMAEASRGSYINLTSKSAQEGFATLKYQQYQYLGYESSMNSIDIYPNTITNVGNTFSIAGKNISANNDITLLFGYDNKITERVKLNLKEAQKNVSGVSRMWAQKRLDYLQKNAKVNKTDIIHLATTHHLVTDYTSLIVLEQVSDYIRYKIKPPAELLDAYNKALAKIERAKKDAVDKPIEIIEVVEDAEIREFQETEMETEDVDGFSGTQNNGRQLRSASPRMMQIDNGLINTDEIEVVDEIQIVEADEKVVEEEEIIEEIPFIMIEESPIFPGCEQFTATIDRKRCFAEKMQKHIKQNFNTSLVNDLNFPEGRQRVYAIFTINPQGIIQDIRVRAPHQRIEEEIKRMLRILPTMIPGKQRNRNVSVRYTLPITFYVGADGNMITNGSGNTTQSGVTQTVNRNTHNRRKLEVADQTLKAPYIIELRAFKSKKRAYEFYLLQRTKYEEIPAYYVDVSNFFREELNAEIYSNRILSNIAETDFDSYELLKVYGYQLQAIDQHKLAFFMFQRVLELRPEDVQSYRDLALAHENLGECQEAFDLLERVHSGKIYKGTKRRVFKGLNTIIEHEMERMISKYGKDINTSKVDDTTELTPEKFDVRIVVDWNHNDTDIDLHVIDPNLEECSYKHTRTKIGGQISKDMTQGFGPEEFILKDAIKGDYFVKIKYFGDRYQKIENPTFMKVTLYTYYGTLKQRKEVKIIRLTKSKDEQIVAKLSF